MTGMIDWLIGLGVHHLVLVALAVGTLSAWCLTTLVELLLISPAGPDPHRQAMTVLLTVATTAIICAVLWHQLAPQDSARLRWTVSVILSPISPFSYVWIGRWATARWPGIGSVWSLKP